MRGKILLISLFDVSGTVSARHVYDSVQIHRNVLMSFPPRCYRKVLGKPSTLPSSLGIFSFPPLLLSTFDFHSIEFCQ
jgi:hypothetical protein